MTAVFIGRKLRRFQYIIHSYLLMGDYVEIRDLEKEYAGLEFQTITIDEAEDDTNINSKTN